MTLQLSHKVSSISQGILTIQGPKSIGDCQAPLICTQPCLVEVSANTVIAAWGEATQSHFSCSGLGSSWGVTSMQYGLHKVHGGVTCFSCAWVEGFVLGRWHCGPELWRAGWAMDSSFTVLHGLRPVALRHRLGAEGTQSSQHHVAQSRSFCDATGFGDGANDSPDRDRSYKAIQ